MAGAKEHRAAHRGERQFRWKDLGRDKKQLCLLKLQQINHYSAEFPVQRKAGALGLAALNSA